MRMKATTVRPRNTIIKLTTAAPSQSFSSTSSSLSGEERKARLKQRCMEDVAAKRSKLIRSLRNAPGSVSQVGHSIVEAMQSECAAVDPEEKEMKDEL